MRRSALPLLALVVLAALGGATPAGAACPPDERYLDVPDGMEYSPTTCVLRDGMTEAAQDLAARHGMTYEAARAWLDTEVRLDPILGAIQMAEPEWYAGFGWSWSGPIATLVVRFNGALPEDVMQELSGLGVPVQYVPVAHSRADLDALAQETMALLGSVAGQAVVAVDELHQRVTASVNVADLTPDERIRIDEFLATHPLVHIDLVNGPVVELYDGS